MVWVQGGGHPSAVAPSPQSPVLGAFVRNSARPVTLSYGSPALGGGPSAGDPAPPKDTLRILAPGRPKNTGKTVVPSFMVSTLSICVPRMLSRALVGYSQYALLYKKLTQFVRWCVQTPSGGGDVPETPRTSFYGRALGFTADRSQRPSSNVLNTEFDVSYLVPDGNGGYFGEVLIAVPKDPSSMRRAVNETLFLFPTPQAHEVDLICDRNNLSRNAGDDKSDISKWRYSVPACGNKPEVPLCPQSKLWLNRHAVTKLIGGGFLRGPKDMWMTKDPSYIDRVHRLLSATANAVRLEPIDIARELYPADDTVPVGKTATVTVGAHEGGTLREKRRSPITQYAKYLVSNMPTLRGLLAILSIVLTYGKKASIATQMQRQHDAKQGAEQDGVCDQLMDAMCMDKETPEAAAFRKSMPPPLHAPMSIAEFEASMNKALRQMTSSKVAGAREAGGEHGEPRVSGDVSACTWGILFTLTHLFPSQANCIVGDCDARMGESGSPEASLDEEEYMAPEHQRWMVKQFLESVMLQAHPRLTFVMGPCLRAFSHLHGVPHRILDIWYVCARTTHACARTHTHSLFVSLARSLSLSLSHQHTHAGTNLQE